MALKLAKTIPAAALLPASLSVASALAAIPGAMNLWDLSLKPAEVSGGTPIAIPTVFGPDRLDALVNTTPGSRSLVTVDGIPGLRQSGSYAIGTTTFPTSGVISGGWCMALLMRLNHDTTGIRMATIAGPSNTYGRLLFQDAGSYTDMFSIGACTRRVINPVGWHGFLMDFDGTKLRVSSVREGYATGISGVINFGEVTPPAGTYTTATGLSFGAVASTDVGTTFGAAFWGTKSVWGTAHQTTIEKWLKYRLGILA